MNFKHILGLTIILLLLVGELFSQAYEPITVSLPEFIAENGKSEIDGFKLDSIINSYDQVQVYSYDDDCILESVCPSYFSSPICMEYIFESGNLVQVGYENSSSPTTYEYDSKNRRVVYNGYSSQRKLRFDSLDRIAYKSDFDWWTSYSGVSGHDIFTTSYTYDSLSRLELTRSYFDIQDYSEIREGKGTVRNIYEDDKLVQVIRDDTTSAYYAYLIHDTTRVIENYIYNQDTLLEYISYRNNREREKILYSYTDSSRLEIHYTFSHNNVWKVNRYYDYLYNSKRELTRYRNYYINADTIREVTKDFYSYDALGNLIEHVHYVWGELDERYTYTFDEQNNLIKQVEYDYEGSKPIPEERIIYEYDHENRLIKYLEESVRDGEWRENDIETFTYNEEGFLVARTTKYRSYKYFYSDCMGNNVITNTEEEISPKVELKVYPNPSNNYFTLDFEMQPGNYQISIADLKGRILESFDLPDNLDQIELGHELSPGTYFIYISKGMKIMTTRTVVKF